MTVELLGRLFASVLLAFFAGKLVARMKLPAILGWLMAGMIMGPHALGLLNTDLLSSTWYKTLLSILECATGIMIGSELVLKELKKSGKQIMITTVVQSLLTFFVVSLFFAVVFYLTEIPMILAPVFGSIALATAPAPALSIVKEFKTEGPVTRTLIPLAALDDVVAILVFFTLVTLISASGNQGNRSLFATLMFMIVLPLAIGFLWGIFGSRVLKKDTSKGESLLTMVLLVAGLGCIGLYINRRILPSPMLNFMLMGLAFSATSANLLPEKRQQKIMEGFQPVLGFALLTVIVNLGAPLDYRLILGAGLFTVIYIGSRALGKYSGAYLGAKVSGLPDTVRKYLGLTLLPHSGVSLVFTGIAVTTLQGVFPSSAQLLQGTIAAAAVINEVIAVLVAKKAFEWAGEIQKDEHSAAVPEAAV